MKSKIHLISLVMVAAFIFSACKKEPANDTPTQPAISKRVVKYEITGNYTGKLFVAFTTASGGTDNATINALPWTKEIAYNSTVGGVGFSGNTVVGQPGIAGQSATVKVYSGGNVVITEAPSIANATGIINLPGTAYVFP
jgi:hypothetical protein